MHSLMNPSSLPPVAAIPGTLFPFPPSHYFVKARPASAHWRQTLVFLLLRKKALGPSLFFSIFRAPAEFFPCRCVTLMRQRQAASHAFPLQWHPAVLRPVGPHSAQSRVASKAPWQAPESKFPNKSGFSSIVQAEMGDRIGPEGPSWDHVEESSSLHTGCI